MDSMIRRIVLKNFMSHEHTVIEPVAARNHALSSETPDLVGRQTSPIPETNGLTVLIGDNNSGKSAIVAALQTVAQNASGDYMVRHGEKECEVTVETCECGKCFDRQDSSDSHREFGTNEEGEYVAECPQGHVLTWRRIKNKTSYVVNGRVVDRLRGNVPDDLHDLLRMPLVVTPRGTEFDIHFGEQKSPIFLLGDSATDRAAFFASSSDTARLIEMQRLHNAKIKDARSQQTLKRTEQSEFEKRLETLQPLGELETAIIAAEAQFAEINTQKKTIQRLQETISGIELARIRYEQHSTICRTLQNVNVPPRLEATSSIARITADLMIHQRRLRESSECIKVLANCKPTPQLEPTQPLFQMIRQITRTIDARHRSRSITEVLSQTASVPVEDVSQQTGQLEKLIDALASAGSSVENQKKKLVKRELEKAEAETALRENFEQLETCPTCGQSIDVDTALAKSSLGVTDFHNHERDDTSEVES